MKIISKGGIHNAENTAGIINIEGWEGATMRINVVYMKSALKVIENLNNMGLDGENFHIGIAPPIEGSSTAIFCIFLDSNKTVAYAIAGVKED